MGGSVEMGKSAENYKGWERWAPRSRSRAPWGLRSSALTKAWLCTGLTMDKSGWEASALPGRSQYGKY